MESRHPNYGIEHVRLLTAGYMDPHTTGQMRPPYNDLCRPAGTDASLSSYHNRYLPSMPISTGSSFPFLGGMFSGSLPGPPTSPFRTPSTPGVNSMRQFWPPTPPPDGGYGRLALNTNLFPLFGAPPDSGAFLTQGLVSRLGSATHLSPLIDHKEHSFFSHGIGLGTPLTPTSHVTSPSPYPHLIPSLERHPSYGGHMTLGGKELEELHDADDGRLMKSHLDCLMKQDIPSSRPKSKHDGKHCCDKTASECCKLSCIPHDNGKSLEDSSKLDNKSHNRQPVNKVQPCKIEVSHSPTIKPDILSPPIESPKSDVPSPVRNFKKTSHSPFIMDPVPVEVPVPSLEDGSQTRCSQCCASIKEIDIATKLGASETRESAANAIAQSVIDSQNSRAVAVVSSVSSPVLAAVNSDHPHETVAADIQGKSSYEKESSSSVITTSEESDKDESICKSNTNTVESPLSKSNVIVKHVTAAVIPTAPKQTIHRDIHPESTTVHDSTVVNADQSVFVKEQKSFCTDNCIKLELVEPLTEKTLTPNSFSNSTNSFSNRSSNKNLATSCKVKDMIKNNCKQMYIEKVPDISPVKNCELEANKIPSNSPSLKDISTSGLSMMVNPIVISKSPNKSNVKMQYAPLDNVRKCSPFSEDNLVMKSETINSRLDCDLAQKTNPSWTKATVSPFNWQGNSSQDEQAINLTVSKKVVKPEPNESTISELPDTLQGNLKISSENNALSNSGIIGVCHPNPTPIAMNKMKTSPAVSSISNFASISLLNQPAEQATEVHILHRASKSSFPVVNRNGTSPVPLKSTISHVTANTSIHRSLKTERLMTKRGKISEMDKINNGTRTTLATLAPKLAKSVNFGKDIQTSHTISTSSSVSSTSIVFPATVNPCIPVGIAIAQQRQDSSTAASLGKPQSSVPSSTPNLLSANSHLSNNRLAADLQTPEVIRDQKSQDLPISNNATPVDTNLLVAQGPTIVSRQWESEALTRAAIPSSWVAHGSIVAPAVWLGQSTYTAPAAPATNTVPSVTMNSIESSPISLPPGGYQLARDSITGHLLLIPTANIELMDRSAAVWPAFSSTAGSLPIQQLVTQQQHTQFEQVLPPSDNLKAADAVDTNCNITCDMSGNSAIKAEEKMEDLGGQVSSVPLATGQTYAFTTFPTQCDPSGFSYVLQSSTVMHLAHTQTTASIQTESGRRSQGTSPLHCATPSPPPNTCSVQVSVTEDEEESENESDADGSQPEVSGHSVTMAIQVDMDSQTNSEEDDDDESKVSALKSDPLKVEMSDSANQTESVPSESPKLEPETEDTEVQSDKLVVKNNRPASPAKTKPDMSVVSLSEETVPAEPGLEIVTSETELAPSLPVESKPVMDFIDHHGLNLLVDSIEEFASREQQTGNEEKADSNCELTSDTKSSPEIDVPKLSEIAKPLPSKSFSADFKTLDTSLTDGLGLLCALAEQRFFEEALNDDTAVKVPKREMQNFPNTQDSIKMSVDNNSSQCNSSESSSRSSVSSSPYHREGTTEMEMRLQIEELHKKYKQKQRELELLRKSKEKDEEDALISISHPKSKKVPSTNSSLVPPSELSPTLNSDKTPELQSQKLEFPSADSCDFDSNSNSDSHQVKMDENVLNRPAVPRQSMQVELALDSTSSLCDNSSSSIVESLDGFSENLCELNGSRKPGSDSSEENKNSSSSIEQDFDKNDKSKTPFFDEQAWFVRRSERIFLSDARTMTPLSADKANKKLTSNSTNKGMPERKENTVKLKNVKPSDDTPVKKNKKIMKPKAILSKKRSLDLSLDSESSCNEQSSDDESSDAASCTSENLPLSTLVEHTLSNKAVLLDRQKRISLDSECSSGQSEDLPLSVLLEQKIPELKSCILKPEDLQENARLLVLDEGLFYAGYITKSENLDMYGILIDGDRAARPHMFSKEEILNAAVLEVKPTHKLHLPEGSRICAFWSQQYRCLYPGTVTKASSPLPDPSMLYVEFDDGDHGRIPLNDIRMLPSDFPIVSMEPNPFMILGKRRSRAQSQNNIHANSEYKSDGSSKSDREHKKQKKPAKKFDIKVCKDKTKCKSSSVASRSRSSSKSSVSGSQNDVKVQSEDKNRLESKLKHSENKSKDGVEKSKPKKHKKHKEDHHKHHHHHHHKHHHHKRHKTEKPERSHSSNDTVIHSSKISSPDQEYDTFILENSKSDLTVKIKKSPSPHTNHEELSGSKTFAVKKQSRENGCSSSDEDEPPTKKQKKSKPQLSPNKPSKRKERVPSVEKSKIAAFLPVRQLWRWSGKSFRRPGAKGKAKKEFYRSIQRGKETIKVGDCAVFLSTGRPHLPYIGRIETMWESWGGKMDVKVKWFYHPEETKSGKKLSQLKGALFQSPHFDENDVQTISHKCEVLSWSEYRQKTASENSEDDNDTYFLAGTYDPIMGTLILEPDVPNVSSGTLCEP